MRMEKVETESGIPYGLKIISETKEEEELLYCLSGVQPRYYKLPQDEIVAWWAPALMTELLKK